MGRRISHEMDYHAMYDDMRSYANELEVQLDLVIESKKELEMEREHLLDELNKQITEFNKLQKIFAMVNAPAHTVLTELKLLQEENAELKESQIQLALDNARLILQRDENR